MPASESSHPAVVALNCPIVGVDLSRPDRWRLLLLGFVALGIGLRMVRYLLNFPLWGDEAFLAASFIDRDFASILGPLEYNMVAPPLFLWGELAAVKLLGFSELSLRLLPTLASVASVGLFWWLARRWLIGFPLLFAVAIFSVSYYPIRHGNEVKPYATDLFAALVLLVLATEWLREPTRARWLLGLTLAAALAVLGSFTAVFVAGGLSIALVRTVWRMGDRRVWVAFAIYNACLVVSFAAVYLLSVQTQYSSYDAAGLKSLWNRDFPPLDQPLSMVPWLIERHTGHMFSYPNGGGNYASTATTMLLLVASFVVWRRGSRVLLAICWMPLAMCLVAAALQRYPYGGSARTMQFVAPAVCLLAGIGAAALLSSMRRPIERRWGVVIGSALLLAFGGATFVRDVTAPYKTVYDQRSREFARWFWREQARDADLVCVKRDHGIVFNPIHWSYDRTAVYQCQQRMYSQPERANQAPAPSAISARHPLRCVLYNEHPVGQPAFEGWLNSMLARYELRDRREFFVNPGIVLRNASYEDRYVVYEFIPRPAGEPPAYVPGQDDLRSAAPPATARRP